MMKIRIVLMVFAMLLMALTAHAAKNDLGIEPSRTPVKITSDKMVYDEQNGTVTFTKNVVAEHGDLTLWADKVTAFLVKNKSKGAQSEAIDYIVAEGSVKAKKGESEGTCGKLTYVVAKQYLKMEQNPQLQDGSNLLSGKIIKFYARENRSEVIGGKGQRVKAIFQTPSGEK